MIKKKHTYILAIMLAFSACSEDSGNEGMDADKEALAVSAGVNTSVVIGERTRASGDPEFMENFDLYMEQTAPTTVSYTKYDATYNSGKKIFNISDASDGSWYWDDNGGVDAKLNLIGIHPKNNMTVTEVFDTNGFDWTIKANQTALGDYEASDLVISKLKKNYTHALQKAKNQELEFSHVLSQFTFKFVKGTGFDASDTKFEPTLTIAGLKTVAKVKIDADGNVIVTPGGDAVLMTPKVLEDPKNSAAIVTPGQELKRGDPFITIQLKVKGTINTYQVPFPGGLEDAVSPSSPDKLTLLQGRNYVFEITINKTNSTVSATIADWDKVNISEAVDINPDINQTLNNANVVDGASLNIMIKKDNAEVSGTSTRRVTTFNETKAAWDDLKNITSGLKEELYWDDIPKTSTTFAHAILFNYGTVADVNSYPEKIYVGKSQQLDKAYKYLNFANMQHPFAKVIVRLITEKDATYKVNLAELTKIEFDKGIAQFKSIDIASQVITYRPNTGTGDDLSDIVFTNLPLDSDITINDGEKDVVYECYDTDAIYIKPTSTYAVGATLLNVFHKKGDVENKYPLRLTKAVKFEGNKEYVITITLKKTEIADVGVTIAPWEKGNNINGGSTIKD